MSLVYVISESDREQLIKWLNGLPSATLNPAAPAQEEAPAEETASAQEEAPTAPEAAPAQEEAAEVSVESQT